MLKESDTLTLDLLHSNQLIAARVQGFFATLRCYERNEFQAWRLCASPGGSTGYAGRNGVSACKREGDGCTPAGLFRLGYAFGNREKPETKMVYRQVTADSVWVDDPGSPHYNTWQELGAAGTTDWASAERLYDYKDSYAYAVIIEYNTAPVCRGYGSAIFLHCGDKPTSGCIAVPERFLLEILRWLDPDKAPVIVIATG